MAACPSLPRTTDKRPLKPIPLTVANVRGRSCTVRIGRRRDVNFTDAAAEKAV
jgi:hypothetical protein